MGRRTTSHGYYCEREGCHEPPVECYYPSSYDDDGNPLPEEVAWLCLEHAAETGFCKGCRQFWGGVESFEFGRHPGYCENCASDIDAEMADEDFEAEPGDFDEALRCLP